MAEGKDYINIGKIILEIWNHRKQFFIVGSITFIVSCIIILPIPRTYTAQTVVSPETSASLSGGALGSLASSFGINIGSMQNSDALFPELYPDIISTNDFIVGLFDVQITTKDGSIHTDYYTYIRKYKKRAYYKYPKYWIKKLFYKLNSKDSNVKDTSINPHQLSREVDALVQDIRESFSCAVDKQTGVISIKFNDQDPLVCAMMADTIRERLQNVITDYRTQKARSDAQYYLQLLEEAEKAYIEADKEYYKFCDANWNSTTQFSNSERERLQNIRSLRMSTYNALENQYQIAAAKVQEQTPVYAILKSPCVPIKASKPKRVIFVLAMCFLACIVYTCWLCRKDLFYMQQEL